MTTCDACGAANGPGDAFCGNCGAFLEWDAGAASDAAGQPTEATTSPVEPAGEPAAAELLAAAEAAASPVEPAGELAAAEAAASPVEPAGEPAAAVPEPTVVVPALPFATVAAGDVPPPGTAAPAPEPAMRPTPALSAPAAAPGAEGPATAAPPLAAPAGPVCPACGRQNDAGRTFCRTCGTRLPTTPPDLAATRPAAAPMAVGSAAAPRSPVPSGAAPTRPPVAAPAAVPASPRVAPVVAPVVRPAAHPEAGGPERNRVLYAGIAIAVVVVAAVGAFALFGGGNGGGSTAGPSASPATTPAAASPEAPSATVAATAAETPAAEVTSSPPVETTPPTPVPTIPTGPSVGITVLDASSSTSAGPKSGPAKAHDGSPATAWLEGSKDLEGQWIEIHVAPAAVTRLSFSAGLQSSKAAYQGNPRPHNVTISFDGGEPLPLALTDTFGAQRVDIPAALGIASAQVIRITIIDAYPAKKTGFSGSPTATAGFSEIRVFGIPTSP